MEPGTITTSPDTHTMLASTTTSSNEAFAEHLLALMGVAVPSNATPINESEIDELLSRHHSRSNAELQVEKAVLEMGKRLRDAEEAVRQLQRNDRSVNGRREENGGGACPTCHRPTRDLLPITPMNHLTISRAPPILAPPPRDDVVHSPMSAETELELLKAQVQDIARVCKAVALGDLTQKIIVPVKGQEMIELKGESTRRGKLGGKLMRSRDYQ